MADWKSFEQRIEELERKRKPSQNRRAVFDVIKSSKLQPHPDFGASLYLGPLVDPAGQPICLEYTNDRPNLWFHASHAEKLGQAGLTLERKPPSGAESEDRHAGLKGKGFKDLDAFRLGGLDPDVTRSALAALGMLKTEGDDLKLSDAAVSRWISRLRQFFPSLDRFDRPNLEFDEKERSYKLETAEALRIGLENSDDNETLLQAILGALQKSNLLQWRVYWPMTSKGDGDTRRLALAFRALATAAEGPAAEGHAAALADFGVAWAEAVPDAQRDHARQIGEVILMHLAPETGIYVRHSVREELWREGYGTRFPGGADLAETYRNELLFMNAVRDAFEVRGLAPRDMIDVQGALWVIHNYVDKDILARPEKSMPDHKPATNLILYGPPGTGKTFTTAAEAVRLCGEVVPQDRADLMTVYQRLLAAGRIEFVTFHQSISYEDFVEGRQPMTGSDGDGESESAGFRLETVHGFFRRIAKRAETSRGRSSGDDVTRLEGRQVFKMSIGEANKPEDAHLFEEAIKAGYTLLGFDDIDWSDEKYGSRDAIFEACRDHRAGDGNVDSRSGWIQMPFRFRNWIRKGDIIIVSKGNQHFRAIGEFVGDYEFRPRPEGGYAHRRAVRWLWVDPAGVPVSEIYSRGFMQQSIYLLYDSELNIPALERYMNSQRGNGGDEPDQFVLIIDEINRANISKVFGELITLLEADKRLNQPNAVRVRLPYSGDEFGVASNLHVLGTMNTADRSIALLDTALRRRFTFREMMPDASILEDAGQKCGIDLPRLLITINERIEYLFDREHQIGHAYFTACRARADVDEVLRHKVIPLLAEYFFEDWAKIAAVLGDLESHEGAITGGFLKRSILKAPPGFEDGYSVPRFRWQVRSVDEGFDYSRLIGT